jgi:hypothetical protein
MLFSLFFPAFIAESDSILMRGVFALHQYAIAFGNYCRALQPPIRTFIIKPFLPPHQKVFSLIHIQNVQN